MSRRSSYSPYRGRSGRSGVLKVIVLVLAVVLAALAVVFFWLQNYLVYTADGWRLSFGQADPTPTPVSTPAAVDPVVVTLPPEDSSPEHGVLRAVEVSLDSLLAGSARAEMEAAGGNAVLLDMKDGQGRLAYVSQLQLALDAGASGGDLAVNQAIAALKEDGVYLVARMSCFQDHLLPGYDYDLAILTNSGYRWTDPEGLRWSSPTSSQVRDYLSAVAGELAGLGFDEILLTNAGYPTQGNLHYIKKGAAYDAAAFSTVINGFYRQVSAAVEAQGARVGVLTQASVLTQGSDPNSGQTVAGLAETVWRVWLPAEGEDPAALTAALEGAGMTRPGQRLVLLGAAGAEDSEIGWAKTS